MGTLYILGMDLLNLLERILEVSMERIKLKGLNTEQKINAIKNSTRFMQHPVVGIVSDVVKTIAGVCFMKFSFVITGKFIINMWGQ